MALSFFKILILFGTLDSALRSSPIWSQKPLKSSTTQFKFVFKKCLQETKKSTENITRIVETLVPSSSDAERDRARKYKSTQSLHDLGLDNYPNPEYPESSRLSRKEEKGALQNLNNRLASKMKFITMLRRILTKWPLLS